MTQGTKQPEMRDLARAVEAGAVVRALENLGLTQKSLAWATRANELLRAEAEVAILPREGGGDPAGFAVLPRRPEGSESLLVSMTIAEDGPPHAGLRAMIVGLESLARRRGFSRLQFAAPSRYWDATRVLLDIGYRPRGSFLRLTRHGAPERADTRRCYLTTWR